MRTILVADDSATIRRVVEHAFANSGVRVLAASSCDEALRLARAERPDVLLCGVLLPGGSGYDVADALLREPALERTRTLLLTGAFEAFDVARATACGAVGIITKPFEAAALRKRVLDLLGDLSEGPPEAEPGPRGPLELEDLRGDDDPLGPLTPETPAWTPPEIALPGDESFDLGVPPGPAPGAQGRGADEALRDEIRRQVAELAPGIVRQVVHEVAWEVLPDLLDRMLRRSVTARPAREPDARSQEGDIPR